MIAERLEHRAMKQRAYGAYAKALRHGVLVRPTRCSKCRAKGRVDGHHDDYSKPLEVRWLCRRCHFAAHNWHKGACWNRPRCAVCRRVIFVWLIDRGLAVECPNGVVHSRCHKGESRPAA